MKFRQVHVALQSCLSMYAKFTLISAQMYAIKFCILLWLVCACFIVLLLYKRLVFVGVTPSKKAAKHTKNKNCQRKLSHIKEKDMHMNTKTQTYTQLFKCSYISLFVPKETLLRQEIRQTFQLMSVCTEMYAANVAFAAHVGCEYKFNQTKTFISKQFKLL